MCAGTSQIQGSLLHPSPIPALREVRLELHQNCCRPLRALWPGVGEAPGVAYPDMGADNTMQEHQGHFGQVLGTEGCWTYGVCLQDGAFAAQGEGDEPRRVLSLLGRAEGMLPRMWECSEKDRKCPVAPGALAQHIGLPRDILHGTSTLWRYQPKPWQKKHHSPSMGLAPISWSGAPLGLWGGCSPSQSLLVVQWDLQLNSSAGKWGDLQVLPWKAKSCQQQAGAGFGWRPCAQTVMDSRQPTGSPQRFFGSWVARGSGPKATSVRRRVVGPGGEG